MRRTLLLCLLVLGGCTYPHLVHDGAVDEVYLAKIEENVAEARGIEFAKKVPHEVLTKAQVQARMARALDEDGAAALASQALAYRALGLLDEKTDLRARLELVLTDQVAGFYDTREKKFFVVDVPPPSFSVRLASWAVGHDLMGEFVAAHELVHALQDLRYDLDTWRSGPDESDDEELARRAVVEGEGMLYGYRALVRSLDAASREDELDLDRESVGASGPGLDDAPAIVRETLVFPYVSGMAFVRAVLAAPAAARPDFWKEPPRSTRAILHPGSYLAREEPVAVVAAPPRLPSGWRLVRESTLGELCLGVLLEGTEATEAVARTVSAGWAGDRYQAWVGPRGELGLAWALVFQTPADARAFRDAYRLVQEAKGLAARSCELEGERAVAIAEGPAEAQPELARVAATAARAAGSVGPAHR